MELAMPLNQPSNDPEMQQVQATIGDYFEGMYPGNL